jgi:cell division protein FtsZ
MSINIGPPSVDELKPKIAVIGVGGAGGNAIANMIAANVEGVDFIVANTDAQALNSSPAEHRIQLGSEITEGLGAGARPEVGRAAAEETLAQIEAALDGAHMCFIAAGMGGGTGTGAAPVIAAAARAKKILTVGVVTKPFMFEGTRRMRSADAGIEELQRCVDTLIVIPNQNLFLVANPNTTFKEAFLLADEVLQQGVRGITDLMIMPGLINLDFADVRSVMHEMGKAMMGTGEASGDDRALVAAQAAIANPLLDGVSMQGAKGVIISITGGEDMRLMEIDQAASHIRELVDPDANIIWGSAFNPNLEGKIRVSVVATGITESGDVAAPQPSRSFSLNRQASAPAPTMTYEAPATDSFGAGNQLRNDDFNNAPDQIEEETVRPGFSFADETADDLPQAADLEESIEATQPNVAPSENINEPAAFVDDDMLELGSDDMVEEAPAPKFGGEVEEARPAPRISTGGGTLFERMANLSRGGSKPDDNDDDDDGVSIPRFLNRQNNK